jgi:hypothetical protein
MMEEESWRRYSGERGLPRCQEKEKIEEWPTV